MRGKTHKKQTMLLARIRARQPQILGRALEIRRKYGDPIQNLANLLADMPGSQKEWEILIDDE